MRMKSGSEQRTESDGVLYQNVISWTPAKRLDGRAKWEMESDNGAIRNQLAEEKNGA